MLSEVIKMEGGRTNWMDEHESGGVFVCVLSLFSLYLVNNVGFAYEQPGITAEISAEVIESYVH